MTLFKSVAAAIALSTTAAAFAAPSFAEKAAVSVSAEALPSGAFVKKQKKLKGGYDVVQRGDKTFIVFDEDFRAARGPDLKVFLSPKSVNSVTGKTATAGSLNIGVLQSTKGVQEYEVPAGVNLANYGSVLVHCEEYAVLWGGGDL